ncbi:MAG TPA: hypothetical protein VFP72_04550 [Kineosporiaceae bacterium]|nr:hypothetical protein [Kineosporiaceae bacterium]
MADAPGTGQVAGRLEIPVEADLAGFAERLRAGVEAAAEGLAASIGVDVNADQLREKLVEKVKAAAEGVAASVGVKVAADQLRADLERDVEAAAAGVAAAVGLKVDATGLRAELEAKVKAAAEGLSVTIHTKVENAVAETAAKVAEAQAAADAKPVEIPVKEKDTGLIPRLLGLIRKAQSEADKKPIDVKLGSKDQGGLGLKPWLVAGVVAVIQPVIAMIGQSVTALGSLISAVSPVIGILGALPGLLFSVAGALGVVQLGFGSVAKAVTQYIQAQQQIEKTSTKVAQAQRDSAKSLAGLTPEQRKAAETVADLRNKTSLSQMEQARLNTTLQGMSPAARQAATEIGKLKKQQQAATDQAKAANKAIEGLSPSAQVAARAVIALRDPFKKLRTDVQEGLFSRFSKDIEPTAKTVLPILDTGLSRVAGSIGSIVHQASLWAQTPLFKSQVDSLFVAADRSTQAWGGSLLNVGKAVTNIAVAAEPLQARIDGWVSSLGEWAVASTSGEQASQRMTRFFDDAGTTAERLGRIIKNTAIGIKGFFSAGRESGNTLLGGMERQAERFAAYVNSPQGFANLKKHFDDAVPGARAVAGLIGDIGKALASLSQDSNIAGIVQSIRNDLLPALVDVLNNFGHNLGPTVISTLGQIGQLIAHLSSGASPLVIAGKLFLDLARGINAVLQAVPGLGTAIGVMLGLAAVARLLTGLNTMMDGLGTKIGGFATKLEKMGRAGSIAGSGLRGLVGLLGGPWGIALAAATTALGGWMQGQADARAKVDALRETLDQQTGAITANTRAQLVKTLQDEGIAQAASKLGLSLSDVTDAALGESDALERVNAAIKENQRVQYSGMRAGGGPVHGHEAWSAANKVQEAVNGENEAITEQSRRVREATDAMGGMGSATDTAADSVDRYGRATKEATTPTSIFKDALGKAADKARGLRSDMEELLGMFQGVPEATAAFEGALDSLTTKLDKAAAGKLKRTGTLDLGDASGRDMQQWLMDAIKKNADVAAAVQQSTGSVDKANQTWNEGLKKIREHALALGVDKTKVDDLMKAYGGVQGLVSTRFETPGLAEALAGVDALAAALIQIKLDQKNGLIKFDDAPESPPARGKQVKRAHGGLIPYGLGGPEQDNVPVAGSSGEYMVNAKSTSRWRRLVEAINVGSESVVRQAVRSLGLGLDSFRGSLEDSGGYTQPSAAGGSVPAFFSSQPAGEQTRPAPPPEQGGGTTVITDADGQLIGTMRTAAQRTHAAKAQAARLGSLGTWGTPVTAGGW